MARVCILKKDNTSREFNVSENQESTLRIDLAKDYVSISDDIVGPMGTVHIEPALSFSFIDDKDVFHWFDKSMVDEIMIKPDKKDNP